MHLGFSWYAASLSGGGMYWLGLVPGIGNDLGFDTGSGCLSWVVDHGYCWVGFSIDIMKFLAHELQS